MKSAPAGVDAILRTGPVIAVVTIERVADATELAAALAAGGVRVLEITLRTPEALPAIEAIAALPLDLIIGAGTARRPEVFRDAANAGAAFVVSPGFTPRLADAARGAGVPWLPGVATASEILLARESGFDRLKFFPAEAAGGVPMLEALGAVFPEVRFCPTGGIDAAKAQRYLMLPNVDCVGGSWLAPQAAIASRDWRQIAALAAAAAALRPDGSGARRP